MCRVLKFIIGAFWLVSCEMGNDYRSQLKELDHLLDSKPKYVLDSLKKINVSGLNKSAEAYYHLLVASAKDKNLIYLTQDSTLHVAEQHYKGAKDYYNLARTQYYLAKYAANKDKKEAAYDLFKQAEMSLSQNKDEQSHLEGLIYYQLSRIQFQQGNYSNSVDYCNKSFDKFIKTKDTISAIHSLKLLGQIQTTNKRYDKAHIVLAQALDLINSQENQTEQKICEVKATVLSTISVLYRNTSDIPNALKYGKESIDVCSRQGFKVLSEHYHNVLSAFARLNTADSIKYYCNKMISTAKEEKRLVNIVNGYRLLAQLEEKQGNYKEACLLKDTFNIYKDKHNTEKKSATFIDIEKKYDIAQKEKLLLEAENSQLRSYGVILIVIILASSCGGILYYRHKKLIIKYNQLSEIVQHTEWGFSITKELISENNLAYDELQRILNRCKIRNTDSEVYKKFEEAFKRQKFNYSARLFSTLTDFDRVFIKKIQKKYPNLNSEDTIIAAMLRHRWTLNDIAAVFHVSSEAIRKRKARLKTKFLDKTNQGDNLEDFLRKM